MKFETEDDVIELFRRWADWPSVNAIWRPRFDAIFDAEGISHDRGLDLLEWAVEQHIVFFDDLTDCFVCLKIKSPRKTMHVFLI